MPAAHFQALYDHYPAVVVQMPTEFTSHEFILRLFQQHQMAFIDALHVYRTNDAPMRQVTSQLSRQLHEFPHLVQNIGKVESPDIFGDASECAKWRKI